MALMSNRMFLLIVLLCGELMTTNASNACKMADFPVQENFEEDKFVGKWYEASWIIEPWILPEWNYFDYINIYTKTDYGLSVVAEGRYPFNATECVEPTYPKLFRTGEKAKYLYEYNAQNVLINSSYWIVHTDYDNYALVIGCRELALNGTCTSPDGWLWTRCQKVPRTHVEYMENLLTKFCLSVDKFHTTFHNTECRPDIQDSCKTKDSDGTGSCIQPALLIIMMASTVTLLVLMYFN